jgi:hypothetical protein
MRSHLLLLSALALAACMNHPPPAAAPPEVTPLSADVPLAQISPATINRYLGTYRSGADTLAIRNLGGQLYADRSGMAAGAALKLVGLGTFAGADGTAYLFVPADGSAGRLQTFDANGARRDWTR